MFAQEPDQLRPEPTARLQHDLLIIMDPEADGSVRTCYGSQFEGARVNAGYQNPGHLGDANHTAPGLTRIKAQQIMDAYKNLLPAPCPPPLDLTEDERLLSRYTTACEPARES